ncbi:hypothetical protein ACTMTI_25765 [Nonomuraea sp. H19]|uniref:hypothetical protein n=1 Tax=Nonomuraea sp. H19 TaxID=3452206 RepID=UPI003F89238D
MTDFSRKDWLGFRLSRLFRRAGAHLPELGIIGLVTAGEVVLLLQGQLIEKLVEGVPLWALALMALAPPVATGWLAGSLRRRREPAPELPRRLPFPDPGDDLVGRAAELELIRERAAESGLVVVRGPVGMGTSAVAIRGVWELADDDGKQRYADVRGPDRDHPETPLSVAQRVLRTLGRSPGAIQEPEDATSHVIDALRRTGRVLLLDNVSTWSQVAWLPPRVPGAHIVVAGPLPDELPQHIKPIELGPLDLEAGRKLLARHLGDEHAGHDPQATALVDACLGSPAEIVRIGRWLARNPKIPLRAVVDDLKRLSIDEKLAFVLDLSVKQLRPTAKQLLILLARLPVAEVDHQAAAALLGVPSADDAIKELADLGLVENVRMTRVRVTGAYRDAGAESTPREAAAWRRLVEHFAEQADAFAARLPGDDARTWFAIEDRVLLQVLTRGRPVPKTSRALGRIADALDSWFRLEQRHEDRLRAAEALAKAAKALGDDHVRATAELRQCAILLTSGDPRKARQHFNQAAELRVRVQSWPAELHLGHAAVLLLASRDEFTAVESALVHYGQALSGGDTAAHAIRMINVAALLLRRGQTLDHDGLGAEAGRLYTDARAVLFEALELARRAGDRGAEAHAHELLALAHLYLGLVFDTSSHLQQAERLYAETADGIGRARCLVHRAGALLEDPKHVPEEVAALLDDALAGLPPAGVSTALAHLRLAGLRPEHTVRHRAAGLAALAPWDGIAEPQQVSELRKALRHLKLVTLRWSPAAGRRWSRS